MALNTYLETFMLLCFGVAWPVASLRMIRCRRPLGNGLTVALIVTIGYAAGAAAKAQQPGAPHLPPVFWLYVLNGTSVAVNGALQWFFGRAQERSKPTAYLRAGN